MKNLVIGLAILSLVACKQEHKEKQGETQMETVMVIHDEVMDQMSYLAKLTAELKEKVDTTDTGMKYDAAMKELQAAHDSMMNWMMNFGNRFDSNEILDGAALTPQKQEWLNEEETKVKALREQFNTGIARAEELLNK